MCAFSSLNDFLNAFDKDSILLGNGGHSRGEFYYKETLSEALLGNSKHDMDVYFHPNGKNSKELSACFIDLDAGRDDTGKYLSLKEVSLKKQDMMNKINSCPAQPNLIVDTRNGYQLYWLLTKDKYKLKDWKRIQTKICNYFLDAGADPLAIKYNQLMRVPNTYWCKAYEKLPKYHVSWSMSKNGNYHLNELDKLFITPSYKLWTLINIKNLSLKPATGFNLKPREIKALMQLIKTSIDANVKIANTNTIIQLFSNLQKFLGDSECQNQNSTKSSQSATAKKRNKKKH